MFRYRRLAPILRYLPVGHASQPDLVPPREHGLQRLLSVELFEYFE